MKTLIFKKISPELLRILLVLNPFLYVGLQSHLNFLFGFFSLFVLPVSLKYYQTCFSSSSFFICFFPVAKDLGVLNEHISAPDRDTV